MPSIRYINERGEVDERSVLSRNAAIIPADDEGIDEFVPEVVQRVEYDHSGQTSSITTVCGETENRRESDEQPDVTIEGIITSGNIPAIKSLKKGEEITLVSDIHQGSVLVKRVTIEQNADVTHYIPEEGGDEELAFKFQLQLGQPGDEQ